MSGPHLRCEPIDFNVDPAGARAALALVLRKLPDETAAALLTAYGGWAEAEPPAAHTLRRAVDVADGRLLGAAWAQWNVGETATVWPSQWTVADVPRPDPILLALVDDAQARGCLWAQCLLPVGPSAEARALASAGFTHVADLDYLSAPAQAVPPEPADVLEFVAPAPDERSRLAALVERTYVATLDCPALDGRRSVAQVLDEYAEIGAPRDDRWFAVCAAGREVGCLLLADHPEQNQAEMVYMGLVPEVRGRGWGEVVARQALRRAKAWERARVVLAVDAANAPAVGLYRRAGFTTFDRRSAWMRFFNPPPTRG